jgi:hypothetical protein
MTTLARNQHHRLATGRSRLGAPRYAKSAKKPLTVKWLKDVHLGPCCMECAPHVISADKLLYFVRFL